MSFKNKYTLNEYNKAIELHKQGLGSLKISKILGYDTRNAIEDWINKSRKPYYFSEARINACNSKENVERMRAMNKITQPKAVKIAAELKTKKLPENAKILSEKLAYILGVIYGDGHVSVRQRRVILGATDEDFVLNFKAKIEKWSGFKARFFTRKQKDDHYIKGRKIQYISYIDSVEASKFLNKFDLNNVIKSNKIIKSSFIKGFFDSEGTVRRICNKSNKLGLGCFNTSYSLISFMKEILSSLSIESKIYKRKYRVLNKDLKNYYALYIYKKESILKFYSSIGFSINRKQQRLEEQIGYIKLVEETKMEKEHKKYNTEPHTVFIGNKPFMKFR